MEKIQGNKKKQKTAEYLKKKKKERTKPVRERQKFLKCISYDNNTHCSVSKQKQKHPGMFYDLFKQNNLSEQFETLCLVYKETQNNTVPTQEWQHYAVALLFSPSLFPDCLPKNSKFLEKS